MEHKELKEALDGLALDIKGKTEAEIKSAVDSLKSEVSTLLADEIKKGNTTLIEQFNAELKKVQDHANALDVKLKAQGQAGERKDELKTLIVDNFDKIKQAGERKVVIETKVVGDMTLAASLTGDQPRVYSNTVAAIPSPLVNMSDLITSILIDGGTYTFPRETAGEGSVASQTEGSSKAQVDYDLAMIDVNTNFLAGFTVFSKKMANNLPFLENFLPQALRRKYMEAENSSFWTTLTGAATAATLTSGNIVERIVANMTSLLALNYIPTAVFVNAADYGSILVNSATGGEYTLPGIVTIQNGVVSINGLRVVVGPFVPANKYLIGDFSMADKIVTQGLSLQFFEQDSDNVRKNNITARIEAQIALAVKRPDAFIYGDFTTVA